MPVVATNWCDGPHGSVNQRRILPAPTCVFLGLFSIAESYLVGPVSNHMLVSEIHPCMSNFKLFHGETANGSINHSRFLTCHDPTFKTVAIPEINKPTTSRKSSRRATYPLPARGGNDEKEQYGNLSEAF